MEKLITFKKEFEGQKLIGLSSLSVYPYMIGLIMYKQRLARLCQIEGYLPPVYVIVTDDIDQCEVTCIVECPNSKKVFGKLSWTPLYGKPDYDQLNNGAAREVFDKLCKYDDYMCSPKIRLQRLCNKMGYASPVYIDKKCDRENGIYKVTCQLDLGNNNLLQNRFTYTAEFPGLESENMSEAENGSAEELLYQLRDMIGEESSPIFSTKNTFKESLEELCKLEGYDPPLYSIRKSGPMYSICCQITSPSKKGYMEGFTYIDGPGETEREMNINCVENAAHDAFIALYY